MMNKSDVTNSKGHTYMQWTLAILADMTIFTFGLQLGWVSPATKLLQSSSSPAGRSLTDSVVTWIASMPTLAAMPGVLPSSYLVDAHGRKIGSSISSLKNQAWRRGFLIMLMVLWAHGYNGTFAIVTYASPLLSSSGFSISPELQSLFVPIFMTFGSFMTVVIVDRMGRKILLSAYMAIGLALICLATTQLVQSFGGSTPGWLPVLAMTTALFGQAVGVAPVPYVIMLEMFSFQVRAKLMGILILNIWFASFIQLVSSELITTYLGVYTAFYWFAAVNIFGAMVVIFLLPETRRKSVEQIEHELSGVKGSEEK